MVKMGNYRGIPVYLLQYSYEYQAIESNEEKFYVAEGKLFYHGIMVGRVIGKQLVDFDEEKFKELRAKGWYQDNAELLGKVTMTAETRPQVEERPEYEEPETGYGKDIVDEFMRGWNKNIDNEIAALELNIKEMERALRAVN